MSGRLPKGADLLADIRRQGFRPSRPVFVYLNADRPRPKIFCDMPIDIEICIRPGEAIDSLDFLSLTGLSIAVSAPANDNRLRALLKALQRIQPELIGGGVPSQNLIFAWHPLRGWEHHHVS